MELKIPVPYSVLLIMDKHHGKPPTEMSGSLIAATPSCVAVGTLPDSDGETLVVLTTEKSQISKTLFLKFDGVIETPGNEISVCTALNEDILTVPVGGERSHISIWVNHHKTPRQIEILVGPPE